MVYPNYAISIFVEDLFEYYNDNKHCFKFNSNNNYIERDYFDPRFVKIYDEFCAENITKNNDKIAFLEYAKENLQSKIQQARSSVITGLNDFVNLPCYKQIGIEACNRLNYSDCLWDIIETYKFKLIKYYENKFHRFKFKGLDYIERDYFDPRFIKIYDEFCKKNVIRSNDRNAFIEYVKKIIDNKMKEIYDQLMQILGDFKYGRMSLKYIISEIQSVLRV